MAANSLRLALTVLVPFSLGYFLSYMFRAVNAVVAPNLVEALDLSASQLGILTSAYLFAFALFQLPLGIALDRYGPRRVQTALLATTGVGAVIFAVGDSLLTLTVARAMLGLGVSGGLMGAFKAIVLWYPPHRHALMNSLIMSVGGLGMIAATVPAEWLVQTVGWRNMFIVAATISFIAAELIFFVVPPQPAPPAEADLREQIIDVGRIYADAYFWRLAPMIILVSASHIAIHTLWSGPWFRDIADMNRDEVALYLMVIALGFLFGNLTIGIIADRLGRRGIEPINVGIACVFLFMLCMLAIAFGLTAGGLIIWFVFGGTGQAVVLAYPKLTAHFGAARSGRAQTAMNLPLFGGAFLAQAAIGWVIDLFPISADGGYAAQGYQTAFGSLLILQVLAMVWYYLSPAKPRG